MTARFCLVAAGSLSMCVLPASVVDAQTSPQADEAEPAAILPAGTQVMVTLNETLSTRTTKVGDHFTVTVSEDVTDHGTLFIPKGTLGSGDVTFSSRKGAFGRVGLLEIAVRHLDLDGQKISLQGRYREEGKQRDAAVVATMFAVGAVAGLIQGSSSVIPKDRQLRARTGEDMALAPSPTPPSPASAPNPPTSAPAATGERSPTPLGT